MNCEQMADEEANDCRANDGGLTEYGAGLASYGRYIDRLVAAKDNFTLWQADKFASTGSEARIVAHGWKLLKAKS